MDLYNFISLTGIILIIAFGSLISTNRRKINWHVVMWGIGFQLFIAWFLFVAPWGSRFFLLINDFVIKIMESSTAGSEFLFGPLALAPGAKSETGGSSLGFILAFQALPTVIFFSSLMSILYFYNILPRIIKFFAVIFTKLMKISGAESLCAASNIFVGVESVLTVKPYLKRMTKSELCTVLTAGMATVSSNILAVYVFSLRDVFPNIAGHLISASFLSAPAALAMSKVLLPEEDIPVTLGENINLHYDGRESNVLEAVINGANTGVRLIVGIGALLIAVLGLVALFDQIILFAGGKINLLFHLNWDWSLKAFLGIIFYPFTLMMGIPLDDAGLLSKVIAQRIVVTEIPAYNDLARLIAGGMIKHPRSALITTYALCGFAHIASLAIFIGGIAAVVPEKTKELTQIGARSLVAATLACFLTACVAGLFFTRTSILLN